MGQHVDHHSLVTRIAREQVDVDPVQCVRALTFPVDDQMELCVLVIVVMAVMIMVAVVMVMMRVALILVIRMAVIVRVSMVVMILVRQLIIVGGISFAESMSVGVYRSQLATPGIVERYPAGRIQKSQGVRQRGLLRFISRRMFEPNQVDAGYGQLKTKRVVIQTQVAGRLAVDMGRMLANGFGNGRQRDQHRQC